MRLKLTGLKFGDSAKPIPRQPWPLRTSHWDTTDIETASDLAHAANLRGHPNRCLTPVDMGFVGLDEFLFPLPFPTLDFEFSLQSFRPIRTHLGIDNPNGFMGASVGRTLWGQVLFEASVQICRDASVITSIITLKNVNIVHDPETYPL